MCGRYACDTPLILETRYSIDEVHTDPTVFISYPNDHLVFDPDHPYHKLRLSALFGLNGRDGTL